MSAEEERQAGRELWQALYAHFFNDEAGELEYDQFLDAAEAAGLLEPVVYDPAIHGEFTIGDAAPGDPIFMPTTLGRHMLGLAPPVRAEADEGGEA